MLPHRGKKKPSRKLIHVVTTNRFSVVWDMAYNDNFMMTLAIRPICTLPYFCLLFHESKIKQNISPSLDDNIIFKAHSWLQTEAIYTWKIILNNAVKFKKRLGGCKKSTYSEMCLFFGQKLSQLGSIYLRSKHKIRKIFFLHFPFLWTLWRIKDNHKMLYIYSHFQAQKRLLNENNFHWPTTVFAQ